MPSLSIIVPHREPQAAIRGWLDRVAGLCDGFGGSWELLLVDASNDAGPTAPWPRGPASRMRWLRIATAEANLAAAINLGLAAAAGERLLVVEPGDQYPLDQWRPLLEGLARYEAVFGCRVGYVRGRTLGQTRALGRGAADPDCLFWALERSAARGLRIPRGMTGHASELLVWQGRRCGEVVIDHRQTAARNAWPDAQPGLLTAAAWHWLRARRGELPSCAARDAFTAAAQESAPPKTVDPKPSAAAPEPTPEPAAVYRRVDPPATLPGAESPGLRQRPLRIFFSAGEPSGDVHGANLLAALRRRYGAIEAVGFGGPRMRKAGCRLLYELTLLAVMWFARVLVRLPQFFRLLAQANQTFCASRPDAVVLIDYPGFNWWIARAAKKHGIPVFYYSPPQVWAWATWRVKKMRRLIDHVLSGLPFETRWLNERGCHAEFIGHPFFDEVREHRLDEAFLAQQRQRRGPLVTLLPGSRTQEVEQNFPDFLKVVEIVRRQAPEARFAVAAFRESHADEIRRRVAAANLPIEVYVGRTPELIALADCCLAVSGSVTLELLHYAKPTVVLYRVSRLAFFVQGFFKKVKYISLVNLYGVRELHPPDNRPYDPSDADAADVLFPEYLTYQDRSGSMAAHLVEWLTDRPARDRLVARLEALRDEVGRPGAADAAAESIGRALGMARYQVPAPHFRPGEATASGYRYEASGAPPA